jgi:hypothetical protein
VYSQLLLSLGAPDSVRCARPALASWPLSGIHRQRTAIIHRTVRWCIELSGEPKAASATVGRAIRARRVAPANGRLGAPDCPVSQRPLVQRSAAQSVRDAWPQPTVGWGHRTVWCAPDSVRCANDYNSTTVGCDILERRSASDNEQWMSGGALDCPVRHPTEGKNCLPRMPPTAPSCLGAIKGTPRRMEETPKHTLSILSLPHSISAHLIDFLSDLSSVLVVNLLRFI